MADLAIGQYELDGYLFGLASDEVSVLSDGWDPGAIDITTQDNDNPVGDNVFFGRDYRRPGSMTFTLLVHHDTNCRPALARLAAAWSADSIRLTPNSESILRYNSWGDTRHVYGRPRRFAIEKQPLNDPTYRVVTADFRLSEYLSYGDTPNVITMDLVTSPEEGGIILPEELPWTLGVSASVARRGVITIETIASPFRATFYGPITGVATSWRLQTGDWVFTSNAPLGPGQSMTLDTRVGTLTRDDGISLANSVGRSSLKYRLPVGNTELLFGAADNSITAYATVEWLQTEAIL